jgi:hypothetical protein
MVELGQLSRSGFYRIEAKPAMGPDNDMDLRDTIQRIALERPSYGRPSITEELEATRMDGEPEACLPAVARGQPAVRAQAQVRG